MGGTTGNDPVASFAPAIAGPQHWRISRSHFRAGDRHQEGINAPLLEGAEKGTLGAEAQFDLLVSWLAPVLRHARGGSVPLQLVAGH